MLILENKISLPEPSPDLTSTVFVSKSKKKKNPTNFKFFNVLFNQVICFETKWKRFDKRTKPLTDLDHIVFLKKSLPVGLKKQLNKS